MIEILEEIAKQSPVISLLVCIVIYFYRKEKHYKSEITKDKNDCEEIIQNLNNEIRNIERENLLMLNKLANSLDQLAINNNTFHNEIDSLKEFITLKIESLK